MLKTFLNNKGLSAQKHNGQAEAQISANDFKSEVIEIKVPEFAVKYFQNEIQSKKRKSKILKNKAIHDRRSSSPEIINGATLPSQTGNGLSTTIRLSDMKSSKKAMFLIFLREHGNFYHCQFCLKHRISENQNSAGGMSQQFFGLDTTGSKIKNNEVTELLAQSQSIIKTGKLDMIHSVLNREIIKKFSIKGEFYNMKHINDILFNHQLLSSEEDDEESENKAYGNNILKYMGKSLTAIFKDFLIFDDVYEFLEPQIYTVAQSKQNIRNYASNCAETAHKKYAFSKSNSHRYQENLVNRPNYMLLDQFVSQKLEKNLKTKYLIKYDKRVTQRNQQKKNEIKNKMMQHQNYKKQISEQAQKKYEKYNDSKNYVSLLQRSQLQRYDSFTKSSLKGSTIGTIFSKIDIEKEIEPKNSKFNFENNQKNMFQQIQDLSIIQGNDENSFSNLLDNKRQQKVMTKDIPGGSSPKNKLSPKRQQCIKEIIQSQKQYCQNSNTISTGAIVTIPKRLILNSTKSHQNQNSPKKQVILKINNFKNRDVKNEPKIQAQTTLNKQKTQFLFTNQSPILKNDKIQSKKLKIIQNKSNKNNSKLLMRSSSTKSSQNKFPLNQDIYHTLNVKTDGQMKNLELQMKIQKLQNKEKSAPGSQSVLFKVVAPKQKKIQNIDQYTGANTPQSQKFKARGSASHESQKSNLSQKIKATSAENNKTLQAIKQKINQQQQNIKMVYQNSGSQKQRLFMTNNIQNQNSRNKNYLQQKNTYFKKSESSSGYNWNIDQMKTLKTLPNKPFGDEMSSQRKKSKQSDQNTTPKINSNSHGSKSSNAMSSKNSEGANMPPISIQKSTNSASQVLKIHNKLKKNKKIQNITQKQKTNSLPKLNQFEE